MNCNFSVCALVCEHSCVGVNEPVDVSVNVCVQACGGERNLRCSALVTIFPIVRHKTSHSPTSHQVEESGW